MRRHLLPLATLSLLVLQAATYAGIPAGWKKHQGAYFDIGVPPGFKATAQGETVFDGKTNAVSLWNEKLQVEFYVFSPQWNGRADILDVAERAEVLESREKNKKGDLVIEEVTIKARDKSYIRFVVSTTNEMYNTNKTFGIRVPNMKVYEQVRALYLQWKQTLQQFAD